MFVGKRIYIHRLKYLITLVAAINKSIQNNLITLTKPPPEVVHVGRKKTENTKNISNKNVSRLDPNFFKGLDLFFIHPVQFQNIAVLRSCLEFAKKNSVKISVTFFCEPSLSLTLLCFYVF